MADYSLSVSDYRKGMRVQTHPATDAFMRGLRYGTVNRVTSEHVIVDLDYFGEKTIPRHMLPPSLLSPVDADA